MAVKSLYDPQVRFTTPDGRLNPEKNLLAQKQRQELEEAVKMDDRRLRYTSGLQADMNEPEPENTPETGVIDGQALEQEIRPELNMGCEAEVSPVFEQSENFEIGSDQFSSSTEENQINGTRSKDGVDSVQFGEQDLILEDVPDSERGFVQRPDQAEAERAREQIEMAERMAAQVRSYEAQKEYMASQKDEMGRQGLGMVSPGQMGYEIAGSMSRASAADAKISYADEQIAKAMETAQRVQEKSEAQVQAGPEDKSYLEAHMPGMEFGM